MVFICPPHQMVKIISMTNKPTGTEATDHVHSFRQLNLWPPPRSSQWQAERQGETMGWDRRGDPSIWRMFSLQQHHLCQHLVQVRSSHVRKSHYYCQYLDPSLIISCNKVTKLLQRAWSYHPMSWGQIFVYCQALGPSLSLSISRREVTL